MLAGDPNLRSRHHSMLFIVLHDYAIPFAIH